MWLMFMDFISVVEVQCGSQCQFGVEVNRFQINEFVVLVSLVGFDFFEGNNFISVIIMCQSRVDVVSIFQIGSDYNFDVVFNYIRGQRQQMFKSVGVRVFFVLDDFISFFQEYSDMLVFIYMVNGGQEIIYSFGVLVD